MSAHLPTSNKTNGISMESLARAVLLKVPRLSPISICRSLWSKLPLPLFRFVRCLSLTIFQTEAALSITANLEYQYSPRLGDALGPLGILQQPAPDVGHRPILQILHLLGGHWRVSSREAKGCYVVYEYKRSLTEQRMI